MLSAGGHIGSDTDLPDTILKGTIVRKFECNSLLDKFTLLVSANLKHIFFTLQYGNLVKTDNYPSGNNEKNVNTSPVKGH